MGLLRTPLFATHGAAGAEFTEFEGALLPRVFRGVEAEAAAVRAGVGLFDRSHAAVLTLTGADARRTCNGMFTANIRDLPVGQGLRSAATDEKGRILGLFDLCCLREDHFLLTLDGWPAESFTERYEKFFLLDDVEVEDLAGVRAALSLQGPGAGALLEGLGLALPDGGALAETAGLRVRRRARTVAGGFDLDLPVEGLVPFWEAARAAGAMPVGVDAQEVLRIEAGRVRWPVDMGERALVHEMGLVEECCAFTKGCYVGQEVIHRIDVMGQVQKKIWGLELDEDAIPPLEAEVRLDGQAVGVTRSGAREGGRVRVLALLRKPAWNPGARVEVLAAGRSVGATVRALPFA